MLIIEADGPIPGDFSMIDVGVVKLTKELDTTLRLLIKPISEKYLAPALAITGYSREATENFENTAANAMAKFTNFINDTNNWETPGNPMFFSDNNGFDYMFTHWYFMHYTGNDPFGHTSRNLQDMFRGLKGNFRNREFKKLRKTKHDHNPVNDAKGNAEVLIMMIQDMGLKGLEIE